MIDVTTVRTMSLQIHPPTIVYVLFFQLHILGFAVITVVVVYVILDLDYLREGLIRLQTADQLLVKAREAVN
jgi:hypothetical protein